MEPIVFFSSNAGGQLFAMLYLLSFLLCAGFLFYMGWRRKYPMHHWTLLVAAGIVLFIVGTKIFSYSIEQWRIVFESFQFPDTDKKTVLGGLTLLIPGVFLLKKILHFRFPVFDLLAIILPLVMAVQRIGCLFAGCCFGKPTHLPWGISYGENYSAYHTHLHNGLIHHGDVYSLAVHPTQLYQVIGCLGIAMLVWIFRKRWGFGFSQFLFAIMLYGVLRFMTEFFRDPAANFIAFEVFWGLKGIQWIIAAGVIFLIACTIFIEKYGSVRPVLKPLKKTWFLPFILIILMTLLWQLRAWFTPVENIVGWIVLFAAIETNLIWIYKNYSLPGYRWSGPVFFIAAILFMGQQAYIPDSEKEKIVYNEIALGGMYAKYYQEFRMLVGHTTETGCDGEPNTYPVYERYHKKYTAVPIGFQWMHTEMFSRSRSFKFSVGGFYSSDAVEIEELNRIERESTYGFNSFFEHNMNWFGWGAGIHLGRLRYSALETNSSYYDEVEEPNPAGEYTFLPAFHLRVGPLQYLCAEYNLLNHFPSSSPMPYNSFGISSGLGKIDGRKIGLGISTDGYYVKAGYTIKDKYVIEAFYLDNFKSGYQKQLAMSIGFRYRFGFTQKTRNKYLSQ